MDDAVQNPDVATPVDQGWSSFVQKNSPPEPKDDPKWNDLVQSYAHANPPPEPEPTFSQLSMKMAQPVIDMAASYLMPKPPPAQSEEDKQVDKDVQSFRNSGSFQSGLQNFGTMVNDAVIQPAVHAYTRQIDLANQQWQQAVITQAPKDQYGNQLPETPDQAINRTMALMTAPFASAAAAIGLTPSIQRLATDPLAKALFPNDLQAQKEYSEGLSQNLALLPLQAEGMMPKEAAMDIRIRNAANAGVFEGEDVYFNEPMKGPAPPEAGVASEVEKPPETPAQPPQKPIEEQHASIAADVSQKLQAVGRPAEESDAAAQLVASHYQAVAEQGWTHGTPEEIYQRDSANIAAGKGPVKPVELAQFGSLEQEAYAQKVGRLSNIEGEISSLDPAKDADKITDLEREKGLIQKSLDENPQELEQQARGKIRLATDDAKATITLMKSANASTFIHETGHQWLDEMMRYADAKDAPDRLLSDASTVRQWLGAAEGEEISRAQHEKFARGFERYMMEGVAPSRGLANVFEKFKQWLTSIYQTVNRLRSPITDDIRGVFDRLLSANPEKVEPGKSMADLHEADAAETPVEKAPQVADNIRNEIKSTARTHGDTEAVNAIETAEAGGGAGNQPIAEPAPVNAAPAEPAAVGTGGAATKAQSPYERVPRKPLSLIDWIKKQGGLQDENGEVAAIMGGTKGGLIRKNGQSLDDLARAAQEAGYFTGDERPDINSLLEKIRQDSFGDKQYSEHDTAAVEKYNNAIARNAETDRLVDQFGIDIKGKTSGEIYDEIANHMSREQQAKEIQEITEAYEKELEEAEKLSRPEAWEPEEEETLENERRQEIAAGGAQESATGSSAAGNAAASSGEVEGGSGQIGNSAEPAGRTTAPESTGIATEGTATERPSSSETAAGGRAAEPTGTELQSAQSSFGEGKSYYVDKKGVINWDLIKTPEDIQNYLQEWAEKNPDKINEARGGVVTLEQTAQLAESMGMTTKDLLSRKVGELYDGPQQVAAAQLFIQSAKRIKESADAARASGDAQAIADFFADLEDHKDFQDMFLQQVGISAEASRALGARRAIRKLSGFQEAMDIGELFQRMTGTNLKDAKAQADLFASLDDPAKLARMAQKTREANWFDYAIAYRNNNLLSGPVTHLHYLDGNIINSLYKPIKTAVASLLPGGPKLGEAGAMYNSMVMGSVKGWQAAKQAWADGLDKTFQSTVENYKRPTTVVYNPTFEKFFNVSSRAIGAIHSFGYSLNYEQEIARQGFRQAMSEGLEEGTAAFRDRISDLQVNPTEAMMQAADTASKTAMYMKNPEFGGVLSTINTFANRTAVGRFLFPFAKMELNVKAEGLLNNTVLGLFNKDVRANLTGANGAEARAIQIAGMSMGTALAGSVWAMGDHINGNGPSDAKLRKVWLLTHSPNSIQIGNIAIPLRALGNVGQVLMAGAEIKEAYQDMTEPEAKNTAATFMEHVSRVGFQGTFIQNASDTINAWTNPIEYGDRFLQNTAEGFVPYTTLLAQANRYIDPFKRDVHSQGLANLYGVTDYAKSRIPFASETLQPRVDVLGNAIPNDRLLAAGNYDRYVDNPAVQKLQSIGVGLTMAKRDIMSVPLNDKQYNDFAVTSGNLIQQRLWNQNGYGVLQEPGFDSLPQAAKVKEINRAVGMARQAAKNDMLFRNPEIMEQAVAKKRQNELNTE